jgi:hypothetical protein
MSKQYEMCGECGSWFEDAARDPESERFGDAERSADDPNVCVDCIEHRRDLAATKESIRRLKAWAVQEPTRQRIAAALARECAHYEPTRQAPVRWAFVWEMTGEHQMLRKLVELLRPHWKQHGKTIRECQPTPQPETRTAT